MFWLQIIANMVQCKLPHFTYNSVWYRSQHPDHLAIQIFGNVPFYVTVLTKQSELGQELVCLNGQ